jgi:CHAT domain-containing protein
MDIGDYNEALRCNTKSLELRTQKKDSIGIANSFHNIALIQELKGNFETAKSYYNSCLEIYKAIKDKKGQSNCLHNLAKIYMYQGEYAKAYELNTKSLELRLEINDKPGIAASNLNLALIFSNLGDKTNSEQHNQQAIHYYQEIKDKSGIFSAIANMARLLDDKNDFEKKIDYYNKALKFREFFGDKKRIAEITGNIGSVYISNKKFDSAMVYLQRSLNLFSEINEKTRLPIIYNHIASVHYEKMEYELAIENLKKSLEYSTKLNLDNSISISYKKMYLCYSKSKNIKEAESSLNALILRRKKNLLNNFFALSENEKNIYLKTMELDFGYYFDFTFHNHINHDYLKDTCYNLALQNKGLTLKSTTAIKNAILGSGDSTLVHEFEAWQNNQSKLSKLKNTDSSYRNLLNQSQKMERALIGKTTLLIDFEKTIDLTWKDVRSKLKTKEAAIEFIRFKSEIDSTKPTFYCALIVKNDSKHPEFVELCYENDLKNILGDLPGNNLEFVEKVYSLNKQNVNALYSKIWAPMEQHLLGIKNIYYSPVGFLHKISFAALRNTNGTYLCQKYKLFQLGSTGKLAMSNNTVFEQNDHLTFFGGVQYNSDKTKQEVWRYLPGTKTEIEQSKSIALKQKHKVNFYIGEEASEDNLKKNISDANILHISTHGFFFPDPAELKSESQKNIEIEKNTVFRGQDGLNANDGNISNYAQWSFLQNPDALRRSGLVFAFGNDIWQRDAFEQGEDGVLTAYEVVNMNLIKTKLVVLSACETGLGDIKGDEGVFGLQRAFKMAGAEYIMMSLWQVPDKETAEFMQLFYRNLFKEKKIPVAFHKTQLQMQKKYDPYYWAAFVLIN